MNRIRNRRFLDFTLTVLSIVLIVKSYNDSDWIWSILGTIFLLYFGLNFYGSFNKKSQ